jgi:hypothetical protein
MIENLLFSSKLIPEQMVQLPDRSNLYKSISGDVQMKCTERSFYLPCVQGKVVYGNYAGPKDFSLLEDKRVAVAGSVMLIRASPQISFAQQVGTAVSMSKHEACMLAPA